MGDIEGRKLLALWADFMYLMIEYNVIFYWSRELSCMSIHIYLGLGRVEKEKRSHLDRQDKSGMLGLAGPLTYCLHFF